MEGRQRRSFTDDSRRSAANRELVDDIIRVHRDTSGRYGSPRIHAGPKVQGRGVKGNSGSLRSGICAATFVRA
jgi:hypothetical protein